MNNGIIVITHNGKMPSEGGKRIAYQIRDMVYPLIGPPYRIPKALPSLKVIMERVFELRIARHEDGECPHCHHYPNKTATVLTADKHKLELHACASCGKHFKMRS